MKKLGRDAADLFSPSARVVSLQMMIWDGPSLEAKCLFRDVPEILQMCGTAQESNDATKYGPYCELSIFLMRRETDPTELAPVRHMSTGSLFFLRPAESSASRWI